MSAATHGNIQLVPPGSGDDAPQPASDLTLWICLAVLALAVAVGIGLGTASGQRGISDLPRERRAELLSRTVGELREFCGGSAHGALKDHCRELAAFAARLDACRGECEQLVRRELTASPTR